ncbi:MULTISPECIES: hypothetical protein [unclassified Sphingobacterium]|uniref:hypothetical protein n=1 Tax=unclassified Sphingobacterium TaxID=2609468 RepID=UPI0025D4411B|nr:MULTISPECIES: hypothetical protein [unclassified Sphingobacterium]
MTFEEFFTKKKIDLKALKAADEPLFEEFKAHYSAMGEKSFDHSKKFWFNKLRKSFHLTAEEVVVVKKPIQTDPVETAPAATDATATKPAGFKPRFKAPAPSEPSNQKVEPKTEPSTTPSEATDSAVTETPKPAGFKPRFKPGVTKSAEPTEETAAPKGSSAESAPETPKPTGFKPRFKPGVTKTAAPEQSAPLEENPVTPSETTAPAPAETAKPTGFKPRFKAGVTKTESADAATVPSIEGTNTQPTAESDQLIPSAAVESNAATTHSTSEPSKPTGFKPRFKAGVTKTATPEQSAPLEENTVTPSEVTPPTAAETTKPTGFRPRFKAGVTKTGSTDSTQAVTPPTTAISAKPTAEPVPQAAPTITEGNTTNHPVEPQQHDDTAQEQAAANKPKGFKPRFKAGLTKIDKKEE